MPYEGEFAKYRPISSTARLKMNVLTDLLKRANENRDDRAQDEDHSS